jgi:hypothetical protein
MNSLRTLLPIALLVLLASPVPSPALAEDTDSAPPPLNPTSPSSPRLSRPSRLAPLAMPFALQPSISATTAQRNPYGDLAPVPNRDIEAPHQQYTAPKPRLVPEVFNSRMPGRGATVEGLSDRYEERVYSPAPGARLTVPFVSR